MKVYAKPIKMIFYSDEKGVFTPVKFQMMDENKELITISIGQIIERGEEKLAGNRMLIFKCQSVIDDMEKVYELKYEIASMRWLLWKM